MSPSSNDPGIDPQWILERLPVVTWFCENDEYYTIRYASAAEGHSFGYDLADFIDNRNLFASSAASPEDLATLEKAAEQSLLGTSPVVSRMDIHDAAGISVPLLQMMHGVLDPDGKLNGLAGMALDLRRVPALQGQKGLLTARKPGAVWSHKAERPKAITADWLVDLLPLSTYFTENNPFYTEHFVRGPVRRQLGYSPKELVRSGKLMVSTLIEPDDTELVDDMLDDTTADGYSATVNRLHLVHSSGREVPALIVARGASHPQVENPGVVGALLDLSTVPGLQGTSASWRLDGA